LRHMFRRVKRIEDSKMPTSDWWRRLLKSKRKAYIEDVEKRQLCAAYHCLLKLEQTTALTPEAADVLADAMAHVAFAGDICTCGLKESTHHSSKCAKLAIFATHYFSQSLDAQTGCVRKPDAA
jgi:hypothetical protein